MSRNDKLQYWYHSEFWILIQNITYHQLETWIFIFHMFTSLEKSIFQVKKNDIFWVDTMSLTKNTHLVIQKYVRYWVNNSTNNNYLVVSPFIWITLSLSNLLNLNHQPHLWHNFILIYMEKVITMLALLQHIFVLLFYSFLQNVS